MLARVLTSERTHGFMNSSMYPAHKLMKFQEILSKIKIKKIKNNNLESAITSEKGGYWYRF